MLDSRFNKLEVRKKSNGHTYIHAHRRRTHAHACIYRNTHTNIYTYIHIYIQTDRQTNRQAHVRLQARMHASYVHSYMHTHTHTYMCVHTDRYTNWCLRAHTLACAIACTTKNITFRSKKLDVRKARDV